MGKREVFSYLLGQTMMKNISEKQHVAFERSLENVSLGKIHSSTLQPSVCPKAWTQEVHVISPCFCVETAPWELLSCSHLNFNFYGQNRKEGSLPVYYLLCFPVLFPSDAWDAISVLYRAQEIQHDWKPFASLLKSRSQFCGFAVMTNLSGGLSQNAISRNSLFCVQVTSKRVPAF